LYGRISVEQWTNKNLPYVDNLVNLVVSEDLGDISMAEVLRVLCPNGVAYIQTNGTWAATIKPRPEEIDEWTHYLHDAGGNAVAKDSVVGPPRRYQWIGSPRWSRHHDRMASMSACVSAGGRIFYIIDEGSRVSIQLPSKWTLIARDAFNGTVLWKRPIHSWLTQYWPFKSGPAQLPRRLVAVGDRVYVTLGLDETSLSELDAATGEVLQTYDGMHMTEEVICSEGVLFVMVKENPPATRWNEFIPIHRTIKQAKNRVAAEWPWDEADRQIMAIEVETGKLLWQKTRPVAPLTLAADSKGVYFHDGKNIVCLDRWTGDYIWISSAVPRKSSMPANFGPTLVLNDDVVLFASGNSSRTLTALSAQTGRTLWTSNYEPSGHNCPHDLLVIDGLAWAGATAGGSHSGVFTGWDIHTGQVERQFPPDVETYWFHHRCYRSKATERFLLPSRTGIEFVDIAAEHWITNHWVRGGCLYGIMPCNGLIYAPPHNCACYAEAKLSGFCALATEYTDGVFPEVASDGERLRHGPAYDKIDNRQSAIYATGIENPNDWSTYRHDPARSGFTQTVVPADLGLAWQNQLEGRLTSLVVSDGRLFVASVDTHTVYALSEDNGRLLWSYTADGRVDSPPTIYKGRVLFGSADGWVYCLRANDGALIWRFQAAPQDLRLTAFEQLESVWPVHGSVLVQNDIVYCAAGRSMFLDGGLHLLRLDPATGTKLSENILDDRDPLTGDNLQIHVKGLNMPVALPDVLSSDGRYLFMRSQRFTLDRSGRFDTQLIREQIAPHSNNHNEQASQQYGDGVHLFSPFGLLDDTWFHRSYWVYGKSFASGAGGYYRAGRYAPAGRILAFDETSVYGFGREPQYYKWTTPLEHHLFAADKIMPGAEVSFDANSGVPMISIEKSDSLNPAGKPLAVEAWVKT
ncbi:MAG: PQQ-binding-like beta-propeller repeat protein, partial [Phycisphaerales bacterium]